MTGDVGNWEQMSTPVRGWCGAHRGPGGSADPQVPPLQGLLEEDPGVLAAKLILNQEGMKRQGSCCTHQPCPVLPRSPRVSTATFTAKIVYNIQDLTPASLTIRAEFLERWKLIWPQVFHLCPPLLLG